MNELDSLLCDPVGARRIGDIAIALRLDPSRDVAGAARR